MDETPTDAATPESGSRREPDAAAPAATGGLHIPEGPPSGIGDGSPAPPPPAAAAPSPDAPAPRRRARKILLVGAATLVLLLGLLAALLPTLLSSEFVRATVEREASASAGRVVSVGGIRVDYSRSELRGLEIRYGPAPGDPVLLRVAEIRVPAGIPLAFGGRYEFGTVEVRAPELRIDLREWKKPRPPETPPAASAPPGGGKDPKDGSAPAPVPPFSAKVAVRDGVIVLVDLEGRETRIATFTADASASSDGPAEGTLALDFGAAGKTLLKFKARPFVDGRPARGDALDAAVDATLEALDLGFFREAACAAAGLRVDELAGKVTGTLSARALGSAETGEGAVSLSLTGLVAAGPDLGEGVRVEEPEVKVAAGFRRGSDGSIDLRDIAVEMKGLHAKGSFSSSPDGAVNGSVQANVSLEEAKARAARLGLAPPYVLLGDLAVEARVAGDGKAQRITGSLRADDVQISPRQGILPLDESTAVCDFDAVRIGKGFRIDAFSIKSGSAIVDASGAAGDDGSADLKATAKFKVARVQQIVAAFGFSLAGDFGGTGELDVHVLRAAGGAPATEPAAESTAVLTIRDFSVLPPGPGATTVREPLLEARLAAVPRKDEVEVRSLRLTGAGAELLVAGTAAMDGKSGRLSTVEASLDLAKAAALAGSLGAALPARVAGAATWKGPVSWKDTFGSVAVEGGEVAVRGLEVVVPAEGASPERTLREESVRASVDATLAKAAGGYDASLRKVAVAAAGLDASASGTLAADGTMDLRASGSLGIADALRRAASMKFLEKDPGTGGALDFDLGIRGKPDAAELVLDRLESRDAEVLLHGKGRFAVGGAGDIDLEAGGDLGVLLDLAARAGYGEAVKGAAGKTRVRLTAKASGPEDPLLLVLDAGIEGLRYPDSSGGLPWTLRSLGATAKATVDRRAETASGELELRTDDGGATARWAAACAAGKRTLDATADIDMDLGGLCRSRPDLLPLEDMTVGRVKGTLAVKGPLTEPFDGTRLGGSARLVLDSVRTQPLELKDAAVELLLQRGTVVARSIAAKVNDGTVKGNGALTLAGRDARHFLEFHAEGVRIDPAMAFLLRQVVPLFAVGERGGVSGALRIDLRLDGEGAAWEAVKPNLHGKGVLAVTEGHVSGNGIVGEILDFVGGGKGLGFSVIATEFDVHDERVWNERLTVDGKEHSLVIRGSTTFDGKLDYRVGAKALKLGKKSREKLKPVMDEEGNLPFAIGGTLAKPRVKAPDLKKALGDAAGELLDRLKGKLGGDE